MILSSASEERQTLVFLTIQGAEISRLYGRRFGSDFTVPGRLRLDAGLDTRIDAGLDTGIDTGLDTGLGTGLGTGLDTGLDTGLGTGPGTGLCG